MTNPNSVTLTIFGQPVTLDAHLVNRMREACAEIHRIAEDTLERGVMHSARLDLFLECWQAAKDCHEKIRHHYAAQAQAGAPLWQDTFTRVRDAEEWLLLINHFLKED